jgi:hypothetical protein
MKTKKKATKADQAIIDRHLRIPKDLDDWLVEFATQQGFNSEMEALRQILRERRMQELATA